MYNQINKDQIFQSIIANKDVFIIRPEEEKCTWINPLTVNDIMLLVKEDSLIVVKEDKKSYTTDSSIKFIDPAKFTDRMHKENIRSKELASLSGVSDWSISKYVHHKNKPRRDTLERICKVLKCNPEDILED